MLLIALALLLVASAVSAGSPTAKLKDGSSISGFSLFDVDNFWGIPFATPPTGRLRFRPPQPFSGNLDGFKANKHSAGCIAENPLSLPFLKNLPASVTDFLDDNPFLAPVAPGLTLNEDCLYLDIYRPEGTSADAKLPVMFYIFGGGFQYGSTLLSDGTPIIAKSVKMGKPVIVVTTNYRLGAYGWLGGSEVVKAGPGNWGLLDQRLALEWVADNIAGFGGDPSRVTIFGESSGAISVGHQLVMYDGNNTYNGNPLFIGAIMQSGSVVPTQKLDSEYPQQIFDHVAEAAGCTNAKPNALECLRDLPVDRLTSAQNTVPGLFSNKSIGLSFLPRWDGHSLTDQVYNLVRDGKYAKVPFIIGDQQDEGTFFSLTLYDYDTSAKFGDLIKGLLPDITQQELSALEQMYPDKVSAGSPFNTYFMNEIFPEYKRMAAVLGDVTFQWPRRYVLENTNTPSWSFSSDALWGTPVLGTFHSTDTVFLWFLPDQIFVPSNAYRSYWISFAYSQDPNTYSGLTNWPQYKDGQQNLNIGLLHLSLEADNYRQNASSFVNSHISDLLF